MAKFRIMPHGRLQEWVAEEKGYYADEGLDYEFTGNVAVGRQDPNYAAHASIQSADGAPAPVMSGAFETMEAGRACDVSSACHWAVNMAGSAGHGQMWGHAYSVAAAGIYVAYDSPIRTPDDLRNVDVGVGYHSGSHFSALQALSPYVDPKNARVRFIGSPADRVDLLVEGKIEAVNSFGIQRDILEQLGFRKVLDTTFMIGFLLGPDATVDQAHMYFNALQRAQRDIDAEPERYKHYFERDIPEKYRSRVDVRAFSPGERLVFEPYTREIYEKTHRWMEDLQLFGPDQLGKADYQDAVLV